MLFQHDRYTQTIEYNNGESLPNCVLKWMSVVWIWCLGLFIAILLAVIGEKVYRRIQTSSIFDEFNGWNLADEMVSHVLLAAMRVPAHLENATFYACTCTKLKLIFNKYKLYSNFVRMTSGMAWFNELLRCNRQAEYFILPTFLSQ